MITIIYLYKITPLILRTFRWCNFSHQHIGLSVPTITISIYLLHSQNKVEAITATNLTRFILIYHIIIYLAILLICYQSNSCSYIPRQRIFDLLPSHSFLADQNLPARMGTFTSFMHCWCPPHGNCYFLKLKNNRFQVSYINMSTRSQHPIHLKHDNWNITSAPPTQVFKKHMYAIP